MNLNLFVINKKLLTIAIKLYTPVFVLLLMVLIVNDKTAIPIDIFVKDSAVIAGKNGLSPSVDFEFNPFVGIVSNIGILLWCVGAAICLFCQSILQSKTNRDFQHFHDFNRFISCFGIITLVFLLDDLFMFHETLVPKLFEIIAPPLFEISQKLVYFGYAIVIFWAIVKYRKTILKTQWNLLSLAFLFFASSLTIDEFTEWSYLEKLSELGLSILLEDGLKLLGIVSWTAYFTKVCFQQIENLIKLNSDRIRY